MAERCFDCGLVTHELRPVQLGVADGRPTVVLVCRECFGRHHWDELFVTEWPAEHRRKDAKVSH